MGKDIARRLTIGDIALVCLYLSSFGQALALDAASLAPIFTLFQFHGRFPRFTSIAVNAIDWQFVNDLQPIESPRLSLLLLY